MSKINQIDPVALSKYILKHVNELGHSVNHLKLQKLLYYCDAWHLVYFDGVPLVNEEFEAWMHGPVLRSVWNYYKDQSVLHDEINPIPFNFEINSILDEEQVEMINDVLEEYGGKSAYYLECLTHDELPWKEARHGYASCDRCDEIISKDTMKTFYSNMLYGEA